MVHQNNIPQRMYKVGPSDVPKNELDSSEFLKLSADCFLVNIDTAV